MRAPLTVLYVVQAAWLLVGVTIRVAIQTSHGYQLDVLPAITAAIGLTAVILLPVTHHASPVMYITMASWSIVGSAWRVVLQTAAHQQLDWLPALSLVIAFVALATLFLSGRTKDVV